MLLNLSLSDVVLGVGCFLAAVLVSELIGYFSAKDLPDDIDWP